MIFEDLEIRKTHDIVYLLELINTKQVVPDVWFEKALVVEDYGVELRYPDSKIELSDNDVEDAISIAKEFRAFIVPKLNLP